MKNGLVLFAISGILSSCVLDGQDVMAEAGPAAEACVFTVSVDEPVEVGEVTRSLYDGVDSDKITNLNVFVYHDGKLLSECCRYFEDMSSLMLAFPPGMNDFNIYMVGNVGAVQAPAEESALGELRCLSVCSRDFETMGFPVAGKSECYRKGDLAHFKVKRLVGRYDIKMQVSAKSAEYVVKDVRVRNCPVDIYPFGMGKPASVFECQCQPGDCVCGDRLTESDLARLNGGDTVSLYFLENMQGVLLPGNIDRRKKIPCSVELVEAGLADRCTYLEITADVTTPAARYRDGKYRFYLGQDQITDFSIKRNTLCRVTLDFTQNMVCVEDWRIEVDAPEVVPVKVDKDEAMVIQGAEDMIYVQAFDNNGDLMDFDVEVLSGNGYVNVEKVLADYREQASLGRSLGLRLTTDVPIDGLYGPGKEPEYLSETVRVSSRETYNGSPLFVKDIKVRVYHKLFPLLIKLEKDNYSYGPVLYGRNPMGLGLKVTAEYPYKNSVSSTGATRVNAYQAGGVLMRDAVSVDGKTFGCLATEISPDNLGWIDFEISGVSSVSGNPLAYPRLQNSEKLYPGFGASAVVGPGNSLRPMCLPSLPSDHTYWIQVSGSDDNDPVATGIFGPTLEGQKFSKTSPSLSVSVLSMDNSKTYYDIGHLAGVNPPAFLGSWADEHAACPFYVINGCMVLESCSVSIDCTAPKYEKNASVSSISAVYLAPGRDLFAAEASSADLLRHESGYKVKCWRNISNKLKTEQVSRHYKGKLYMTVNGVSNWVGADVSEYGFSAGFL